MHSVISIKSRVDSAWQICSFSFSLHFSSSSFYFFFLASSTSFDISADLIRIGGCKNRGRMETDRRNTSIIPEGRSIITESSCQQKHNRRERKKERNEERKREKEREPPVFRRNCFRHISHDPPTIHWSVQFSFQSQPRRHFCISDLYFH